MKRAQRGRGGLPKPKYPLVACDDHAGDPLPGYVVCVHAIANPKIELGPIERASSTSVGVVVCAVCASTNDLPVEKLKTSCAHFVNETFGVPL